MNLKLRNSLHLNSGREGFTLIELLIVISIVGLLFSVTLPVSYSMYERYKASLTAEKALTAISSARLESFLRGEERLIGSKDGRLLIDDKVAEGLSDVFIQIESPIKFYKTGAAAGGEVKIYAGGYSFIIDVQPLSGNLTLRPSV